MRNRVAVILLLVCSSLPGVAFAIEQFSGVIQDVSSYRTIVISGKTYRYSTRTKVTVKGNAVAIFPTSVLRDKMSIYYDLDFSEAGMPRVVRIQITGPRDAVDYILNADN